MATNALLEDRYGLVWETEKPREARELKSQVFIWMNYEWFFLLSFRELEKPSYVISLVNDTDGASLSDLCVNVFLEYKNKEFLRESKLILSRSEKLVQVTHEDVLREVPDFDTHGRFTVKCLLFTHIPRPLLKVKDHEASQFSMAGTSKLENACNEDYKSSLSESSSLDGQLSYISCFGELSNDLKALYDTKNLSDVQLRIGDQTFSAHRTVLAARSPVFMFQIGAKDNGIIDLVGVDLSILKEFLCFIYSGKLPDKFEVDVYAKLYEAGYKYSIDSLMKMCLAVIERKINGENFSEVLLVADLLGSKELKETVACREVFESDEWIDFTEEYPQDAMELYQTYFAKLVSKGTSQNQL